MLSYDGLLVDIAKANTLRIVPILRGNMIIQN